MTGIDLWQSEALFLNYGTELKKTAIIPIDADINPVN